MSTTLSSRLVSLKGTMRPVKRLMPCRWRSSQEVDVVKLLTAGNLCRSCNLVFLDLLLKYRPLASLTDLYTVEVARLYGRLHKATLSSENPTIEFSSEFKKISRYVSCCCSERCS
ncbi:unnamed protein product [Sphagnum jensenii]|uniref:Uncharacterized protein n=1 Tax=Sphagnum jensenii TaxID=128206 RepID=A0ABP0W4K1_9BRYO